MSITFDRESYTFKLDTAHTTYMFQVLDGGYLCHLYWGGRIDAASLPFLSREYAGPYVRDAGEMEERPYPLTTLPQEFPCEGRRPGHGGIRNLRHRFPLPEPCRFERQAARRRPACHLRGGG